MKMIGNALLNIAMVLIFLVAFPVWFIDDLLKGKKIGSMK